MTPGSIIALILTAVGQAFFGPDLDALIMCVVLIVGVSILMRGKFDPDTEVFLGVVAWVSWGLCLAMPGLI